MGHRKTRLVQHPHRRSDPRTSNAAPSVLCFGSKRRIQQTKKGHSMRRESFVLAVSLIITSTTTLAACVGNGAFQNCMDGSANAYSTNRIGNVTQMNGYHGAAGDAWDQSSTSGGNTTAINGISSSGPEWIQTTTTVENGARTIDRTDSHGNSFSKFCGPLGCN